ncbi:MaoC/PaaZ C-terminal domain-containing protein, partial [Streptosporangium algeriense]
MTELTIRPATEPAPARPAGGPRYDDVTPGTALPRLTHVIRRGDLVRYAGASGDFNPIHWNERAAR